MTLQLLRTEVLGGLELCREVQNPETNSAVF